VHELSNGERGNYGSNGVPSSLSCRDELSLLLAPKVTKRRWPCQHEASLPHRPLRRKSAKTTGWEKLPRCSHPRAPASAKFPYALAAAPGHHCFVGFRTEASALTAQGPRFFI
jgi:hypothetical protein